MLAKGVTDATLVKGKLADDRMVYVAHKSDQDAAAAVAATIAGYDPPVSLVLKQVHIDSDPFSAKEIDTINSGTKAPESFDSGPGGQGVNWLTSLVLIPGGGVYMGEGYTGNPAGQKFIDTRRLTDHLTFKLKARLIRTIGSVRMTRIGMRSVAIQMEAILDPLVQEQIIDQYSITIPLLDLLDADPASLTPAQLQTIKDATKSRFVEVFLLVPYRGAIERITVRFKLEG
jgi:hypothetical protein